MNRVVVTGGAGYIGRCMVECLRDQGAIPIVLDNFSTGKQSRCEGLEYYEVDLADLKATEAIFQKLGTVSSIIHFAAKALVPESIERPVDYFRNNVVSTLNLGDLAIRYGVKNFVFSSSCAVYGIPAQSPITEETALNPLSPYGESKKMCEQVLVHLAKSKGLSVACLRYFNPSGSYQGKFGEDHEPETHLIPNLVRAAKYSRSVSLFGSDYPTKDGSCIRDFIHIEDLVEAHSKTKSFLDQNPGFYAFNLGTGKGASVKEAIDTTQVVLGKKIAIEEKPRRQGDPPELVADPSLAERLLDWKASRTLEQMIQSQFDWESGVAK